LLASGLATVAVLVAAAAGLAAPGAPPGAARDLGQAYFSNTLTRAEVISVVGRVIHDYRIDEGRVIAVRPNAIDLLERDGTRQTIAVSSSTRIVGVGRLFGPPAVARGVRVVVVTDNGGPATRIWPSASARALGKAFLGTTLVRAEILTYSAGTAHDIRIDEGRIVSVKPNTSIMLLERDGTRQPIAFTASTQITEAGQPADQTAITRGLSAITVRQGDGPASEIRLFPQLLAAGR
jgi:hypothetical protein